MWAKLEYIWLDGKEPTQSMRSKTMVRRDFGGTIEECPLWNFDGSSTNQADGSSSDCVLKPVAIYPDPDRNSGYLVMCEVLNADGTPHETNGRATIEEDDDDSSKNISCGTQRQIFHTGSPVTKHLRGNSTAR
jgi:glutamine synthetase